MPHMLTISPPSSSPASAASPSMASKRQRSQDFRESSGLSNAPDQDGSGSKSAGIDESALANNVVKVPAFLNQEKIEIQRRFHDLEWHQRFRIQHGYVNPQTSPFRIDKSDAVVSRNRYSSVQPWDSSRVKLKTPIGGSDYINASPITLRSLSTRPLKAKANQQTIASSPAESTMPDTFIDLKYIATQGPKEDQFPHFWHMVMQQTVGPVGVVVMLTQCYEGNKEKCSQYFPLDMEDPVMTLTEHEGESGREIAGDETSANGNTIQTSAHNNTQAPKRITLLSLHFDPVSRSEIRKLHLEIDNQTKLIYHYLFTGWPDFGKPEGDDRKGLLELIKQTSERVGGPSNIRFVHCSAGVGRTGTFIALDFLLHELEVGNLEKSASLPSPGSPHETAAHENGNDKANTPQKTWGKSGPVREMTPEAAKEDDDIIFDTVNKLREQRMMMVMNEVQYAFLYEVMKEAFITKYARLARTGVGIVDASDDEHDDDEELRSPKLAKTESSLPFSNHADHSNHRLQQQQQGEVEDQTPDMVDTDALSETETEIAPSSSSQAQRQIQTDELDQLPAADPYAAVAPEEIRNEIRGAGGVGAQ